MKFIFAGAKSSGKSTVAKKFAQLAGLTFIEIDDLIVKHFNDQQIAGKTCAEIYRTVGREKFRLAEQAVVEKIAQQDWAVVATGGGTMLNPQSRDLLRPDSIWVYLQASAELCWQRISAHALPAYLENSTNPQEDFARRAQLIDEILRHASDIILPVQNRTPDQLATDALNQIQNQLAIRSTSPNTIGQAIRVTTFGESHGPMIGAVLDGVPAGLELCEADIQAQLDRRRPGQSAVATARSEADLVQIASGVFEGKTTGAPIGLIIANADQRSRNYDHIKDVLRPGHADLTFWKKFGLRDYRGGGRSSGRETAVRVAAGAIARKILQQKGINIFAHAVEIAGVKAIEKDLSVIESNPVRSADSNAAKLMTEKILEAKSQGDSVGGIVALEILNLPAGLGDPIFSKLDAKLTSAIFSLGAVKGVEIGAGFKVAKMTGKQNNDQLADGKFLTNHAGGILGGISTGEPVELKIAVKPTPSISQTQHAQNTAGENIDINIQGRHDPCIVPRIIPVIEQMAALVILDCWMIQEKLRPGFFDHTPEQHNSQTKT